MIDVATLLTNPNSLEGPEPFDFAVPDSWVFRGRVFGGCLAAACAARALSLNPGWALHAVHTSFVGRVVAGPVRLDATLLRDGSDTKALQVELSQEGAIAALVTVWLVTPALLDDATSGTLQGAGEEGSPEPIPGPDECPPLDWLAEFFPMAEFFDERGILYPDSTETYRCDAEELEIWCRPAANVTGGAGPVTSIGLPLFDLLLWDTHLSDVVYQGRDVIRQVSLDLSVTWHAPAGTADWRRLRAYRAGAGTLTTVRGELFDDTGRLLATASSRARGFAGRLEAIRANGPRYLKG